MELFFFLERHLSVFKMNSSIHIIIHIHIIKLLLHNTHLRRLEEKKNPPKTTFGSRRPQVCYLSSTASRPVRDQVRSGLSGTTHFHQQLLLLLL